MATRKKSVIGVPTPSSPIIEPSTRQKIDNIRCKSKKSSHHPHQRGSRNSLLSSSGISASAEALPNYGVITSRRRELLSRGPFTINEGSDQVEKNNSWQCRKEAGENKCNRGPKSRIAAHGILKPSSVLLLNTFAEENLLNSVQLKKNKTVIDGIENKNVKSPSCQMLLSIVKKSVSFSSDTSSVKRKNFLTQVHEAKVYRKGVLRDINEVELLNEREFLKTWEKTMSQILLQAAREADDFILSQIIKKIRQSASDFNQIDVNATDLSGRNVISYIAGNGAAEILDTVLSFPGVDPNLPDNEGNTPLHFAAQAGQAECLSILLEKSKQLQVDSRNVLGFTPLMKAALQGRTKCAKILLLAGANPTLRDHGRGLRAELWARYCGRHVCADVIERFSRHELMEKTACRWGSEPELAKKVLEGKIIPLSSSSIPTGFKSKFKRVFKSTNSDKSFSLVSQLTNAALCASTPALPKPDGDMPPVKNLFRPLNIPQLRVTLAATSVSMDRIDKNHEIIHLGNSLAKAPRLKKTNK